MSDEPQDKTAREAPPEANVRRPRGVVLVWLVPVAALGIVLWLGIRTVFGRGPLVTISFVTAEGLEAGRTKIRHKSVDVGTVESVVLSKDLKQVLVRARMDDNVSDYITQEAKFWVVRPRLSAGGISGLTTIVSGAYIEMLPGKDGTDKADHFTGLEEPPISIPDAPGRSFILDAERLSSLSQGSSLFYRGTDVGEVLSTELTPTGDGVKVHVFIRAPYADLVRPATRFWNASGFSISAGSQGLRANFESLQALLTGGAAFEDRGPAIGQSPSPEGAEFKLYGDRSDAETEPFGQQVPFEVRFDGSVGGLSAGASVELKGIQIGRVTDVELDYDAATGTLSTPASFEIEPEKLSFLNLAPPADGNWKPTVTDVMRRLVDEGLRARLGTSSLLTGSRMISLSIVPDAPPAVLEPGRENPLVPTAGSGGLDELMETANQVMTKVSVIASNLEALTGSPEIKHSVETLDQVLADVRRLTKDADQQLPQLVASLKKTSDAATTVLNTADRQLGGMGARGSDIGSLLKELTRTARSVRGLTDFLEEHPESLLRGRGESGK